MLTYSPTLTLPTPPESPKIIITIAPAKHLTSSSICISTSLLYQQENPQRALYVIRQVQISYPACPSLNFPPLPPPLVLPQNQAIILHTSGILDPYF